MSISKRKKGTARGRPKATIRKPPRGRKMMTRGTRYERADGTPMRRVGIELKADQDERLKILCVQEGRSVSSVVRELVQGYIDRSG